MAMAPTEKSNGILWVSIVSYAPDINLLRGTVGSLTAACEQAMDKAFIDNVVVCLVDNGPAAKHEQLLKALIRECSATGDRVAFKLIGKGENVGFGAGHNLAFDPQACDFHLVLNPDVELDVNALVNALHFMRSHPDCGMLSPFVANEKGDGEYPCKRYPAVIGLALRGFAPEWLRNIFRRRLANYEMRDRIGGAVVWDPTIVSGCFMLIRAPLLSSLKGFDPRFFLYFEDFDLSLRIGKISRIAYVPSVKIVHHGGNAAKKGWRHIYMFIKSAVQFFNKHGWKWI